MAKIDMSTVKTFPARVIYDPSAPTPVIGQNENTSQVAVAPFHVQVDAIPEGTTIDLQARVEATADWVTIITYTYESTPTIYVFGHDRVNFVRTVRNGTGNVKVYVQG